MVWLYHVAIIWYSYLSPKTPLVIYNHKIKTSLQGKGQFVINTSEMDPSTTIATICDTICDDAITIQTGKLLETAHIHYSNIPGTVTYCKSTRNQFKFINFYNSYVKKKDYIFRTGSLYEYHEYAIRNLLSLYTENHCSN